MDKVGTDGVMTDFVTDAERMEVVLENPVILIPEKKISSIKDLLAVLERTRRRLAAGWAKCTSA